MYKLNPYLRQHWTTKARNKVLAGGRASSKSHDAAGFAIFLAANYSLKFLCARQFQNRITDSVYTLLVGKIEESDYKNEFDILNNTIRHKRTGAEFLFYGLARNIEEIKSTEGVDILWLEEAHALTQEQWAILEPTIRRDNSECWIIFNPGLITDFVWQHFVVKRPDDTIVTFINHDNNPFLSATMRKVIENARKAMEPEEFDHVYGGQPRTTDDKSFISYKFLKACIDAHIKLGWPEAGSRQIGYDIADDGEDLNAKVLKIGSVFSHCETWKGGEDKLLESAAKVYRDAYLHGARIVYDAIGVGSFAGSSFAELNRQRVGEGGIELEYHAFNAGGKVPRPDDVYMEMPHKDILRGEHLENAKAAAWDALARKVRNTYEAITYGRQFDVADMVSFDSNMPDLELLLQELSIPFKDSSLSGKLIVERKKDLRKRGIRSPNRADACVMADLEPEVASPSFLDF